MWPLFAKELRYYIRNPKDIVVISFLFVFVSLLAPFAFPAAEGVPTRGGVAMLWIAMLCSMQVAAAQSWQRHSENGELEAFQLLPWLLEWSVLGKMLALAVVVLGPILLILPLAASWLAIASPLWWTLGAGLFAGGMALVALNQLAAGLMAGQRKGGALLGVITLPFAVPVVIFGVNYCMQPIILHSGLVFLAGYAVLLLPLSAVAVSAAIRAGN